MTAYQVWMTELGVQYTATCESCGEYMRSSPAYDGGGPSCLRRACRKERGAVKLAECRCSWAKHYTGESCSYARRATQAPRKDSEGT